MGWTCSAQTADGLLPGWTRGPTEAEFQDVLTPIAWLPAPFQFRLELRANPRYKWHNTYFYSLCTEDFRRIRLPNRLFPLYFILAPFLSVVWVLRQPHHRFPENRQAS